ncbi:MAG: biosynthetic arginine decarboxylase [Verrucomicrobiota bacterium]|nr:biosynthetic arginine decarboxylase [Verrucomicrobiota bacterium]
MKKENTTLERWTVEDSASLYGINNWGGGFFRINDKGEVTVSPTGDASGATISLMDIISGLSERGMDMPVLIRFGDILNARIKLLNDSFNTAIREVGYQGVYRGVFPIKVNQQQQVIEEIAAFGSKYNHGLEAGSKAELIAAIPHMRNPESLLICNGYKDNEFIELGLYARKMGIKIVFVIETLTELPIIVRQSRLLDVKPIIGVRVKLSSKAGGHWKDSGGDRSVFGLNTTQIVDVVDELRREGMLDCLRLLHYHLGSQVPDIRDVRTSVLEATRIYAGLVQEGAPMGMLDLGGGLAVDYDGSHTNFASSANYTLGEYARDIVEGVMTVMNELGIAHPTLVTESGRATVAYYSVLLFNILDVSRFHGGQPPETLPDDADVRVKNLLDVHKSLNGKNLQECYHDALFYRDEIRALFKHGVVSLRERSQGEQIFWSIMVNISRNIKKLKYVPDDFEELDSSLADIYYGNFSVFQSLPDSWAIDQLFPLIPIHRLTEEPTRNAIFSDITCDCDGKIDRFIDLHDVRSVLPLHEWNPEQEYYLGVFLVGAYQETLGDLHNLLGDTNIVSIRVNDEGGWEYEREIEGDSVADVLSYVEYDPKILLAQMRDMAEKAVRESRITANERRKILDAYELGMRGYTYFER